MSIRIRIVGALAAAIVAVSGVFFALAGEADAAGDVRIDSAHFPDLVFRDYVKKNFDGNRDGFLSASESSAARKVVMKGKNVYNIKGIEYLTGLTEISCYYERLNGGMLKSIDVSKNKNLKVLKLCNNPISKLDVSKNTALEKLDVFGCGLTKLDLSKNVDLKELDCSYTSIKTLDVRANKNLQKLICGKVDLDSVYLGNSSSLKYVDLYSCKLKSLDVSLLAGLKHLECPFNPFTSIDVSKNLKLEYLNCASDNLMELDVSKNVNLKTLECYSNKLKTLDILKNTKLEYLKCGYNDLTKLDVSNCPNLTELSCINNRISNLDVTANPKLEILAASKNEILNLDISDCKNLVKAVNSGRLWKMGSDNKTVYNYDYSFSVKGEKTHYVVTVDIKTTLKKKPLEHYFSTDETNSAYYLTCCDKLNFTPMLIGSGTRADWTSSNKDVATVDSSGKITSKTAGTCVITATAGSKKVTLKLIVMYKDVTNHSDFWFEPTNVMTAKGIVKGYDKQTRFRPSAECSRAQMVTFLWRLAGTPAPKSSACKFSDVDKSAYYYKPVLWAVEKGITTGYSGGKFKPDGICTRAQTVTFLWRMAGTPEPKTSTNPFKDVKSKDYFYKAVLWASEKKIVSGYSDKTFRPMENCLRRQMVTFLYKYSKKG